MFRAADSGRRVAAVGIAAPGHQPAWARRHPSADHPNPELEGIA